MNKKDKLLFFYKNENEERGRLKEPPLCAIFVDDADDDDVDRWRKSNLH